MTGKTRKNCDTCNCRTYQFPHRIGSGACNRKYPDEPYCEECGCHEYVWEDQGVGFYEFWGEKGYDSYEVRVCAMCGGAIVDPKDGERYAA